MADKKISALTSAATPLAGTEVLPVVQSGSTVKVSIDNVTAGRTVALRNANLTGGAAVINIGAAADTSYHYARFIDSDNNSFFAGVDDSGGGFFGAGAYGRVLYSEGAKPLKVFVNGAYRAEYDTSGNYKLDTGNLVIGTAGKGIDFSANGGDVLSQYDEGTWTTTVTGVTNFTGTPTLASGKYTRVGRLVTIEGKFSGTVTTGSTNTYFQFTLPISRGAATDGGAGSVFSNSNLKLGGIYNASADTTTAYLVMPSSSAQPSGADTFFFSYSYYA